MTSATIAVLPKLESLAGPASFYGRFTKTVRERGYTVHNDPTADGVDAVLVIAGTKHIPQLWQAHRKGVRIVQRLDNINWQHKHMRTGIRHYVRSEIGNVIMQTIRSNLADHIVYQSHFARQWWLDVYGSTGKPFDIIYNGVDLHEYSPAGSEAPPTDHVRLLVVEGRMSGGQEKGLENAVLLAQRLQKTLDQPLELVIIGKVAPEIQAHWQSSAGIWLDFLGQVPRADIPAHMRAAHLLFSADLNGACPNVVVESLACGLPVISFDTGALPELVKDNSGIVAPYGTDVWKMQQPIFKPLVKAAVEVIENNELFRQAARERAQRFFSIESVVDRYLDALFPE
jgi:glycosyltransferase involved in cell wall biosynthesis